MKTTDEMRYGESLRAFCGCNQGRLPCSCGKATRKTSSPPELAAPYGSELQANPIERFSVAAQLQLMKGLAILGWAAFFLELLRV